MYNTATIIASDVQDDGRLIVRVRFTGNAGEKPVSEPITFGAGTSAAALTENLRSWAVSHLATLNSTDEFKKQSSVQVGQVINLTPPAQPAQTPLQQFEADAAEVLKDDAKIKAGIISASDAKAKANSDKAKASRAAYLASLGL